MSLLRVHLAAHRLRNRSGGLFLGDGFIAVEHRHSENSGIEGVDGEGPDAGNETEAAALLDTYLTGPQSGPPAVKTGAGEPNGEVFKTGEVV